MKLSSVTKQSKWPVVDDLEISASQANARQERARAKYEKSCQLLVELQAGVEHLYEKLTSALSSHVGPLICAPAETLTNRVKLVYRTRRRVTVHVSLHPGTRFERLGACSSACVLELLFRKN